MINFYNVVHSDGIFCFSIIIKIKFEFVIFCGHYIQFAQLYIFALSEIHINQNIICIEKTLEGTEIVFVLI